MSLLWFCFAFQWQKWKCWVHENRLRLSLVLNFIPPQSHQEYKNDKRVIPSEKIGQLDLSKLCEFCNKICFRLIEDSWKELRKIEKSYSGDSGESGKSVDSCESVQITVMMIEIIIVIVMMIILMKLMTNMTNKHTNIMTFE